MTAADVNTVLAAIGRVTERLEAIESRLEEGQTRIQSPDDFMTLADAAAFLHLSKAALYRAIRERRISSHKPAGGKLRLFKRSDVVAFGSGTRRATSDELETRAAGRVLQMDSPR